MTQYSIFTALTLSFFCNYGWAIDQQNSSDWKAECVGRYQISVPGDVEIAVVPLMTRTVDASGNRSSRVVFSNDDRLKHSDVFVDGAISVSSITSNQEFLKFKKEFTESKNKKLPQKFTLHNDGKGFNLDLPQGVATSLFLASRIYQYEDHTYGNNSDELTKAKLNRDDFIKNFESRQLFDLPKQSGVCIPYGFIKDEGGKHRHVGVGMRLVDHPDVEIFFKDGNSMEEDEHLASQFKGSRGQVEYFWSFESNSIGNLLQDTSNPYHDIKLGEYSGKYAFATIARPSENTSADGRYDKNEQNRVALIAKEINEGKHPLDYGFMAYYKGDPDKKNEPDLMLYVIRTASRAVAVNKTPLSEDELKKMALQIAASIRLR